MNCRLHEGEWARISSSGRLQYLRQNHLSQSWYPRANLVGIKMNGMGAKILIKVDFPILQRLWVGT